MFIGIVFLLALYGIFRVPRRLAALSLLLLGYQWALAVLFVGATRYRVPWDFIPGLVAESSAVDLAGRSSRGRRALV